jgi:hypothetical protein
VDAGGSRRRTQLSRIRRPVCYGFQWVAPSTLQSSSAFLR